MALVDRAGAVAQEAASAAVPERDDLGDDRGGDLLGSLGPEVQTRRPADPLEFRPADPRQVVGNAAKAGRVLSWQPEISFEQTIAEMVQAELKALGF